MPAAKAASTTWGESSSRCLETKSRTALRRTSAAQPFHSKSVPQKSKVTAFSGSATDIDRVARDLAHQQRRQEEGEPGRCEQLRRGFQLGNPPPAELLQDLELLGIVAGPVDLVGVYSDQ